LYEWPWLHCTRLIKDNLIDDTKNIFQFHVWLHLSRDRLADDERNCLLALTAHFRIIPIVLGWQEMNKASSSWQEWLQIIVYKSSWLHRTRLRRIQPAPLNISFNSMFECIYFPNSSPISWNERYDQCRNQPSCDISWNVPRIRWASPTWLWHF